MSQLTDLLHYRLTEQPIYGSARLGVRNLERTEVYARYLIDKKQLTAEPEDPTQPLLVLPQNPKGDISTPLTPQPEYSLTLGNKQYELSNHLGNVQVTLSDKKLGQAPPESSSFTHYLADVRSAVDYYPFGMQMPGRSLSGGYRWGFNGKEKIDEVSGSGNEIDMGDRWLDTRLGRTSSMDAKAGKYPFISPFTFAINNPLNVIDPDGKDVYLIIWKSKKDVTGHAAIAVDNYKKVVKMVLENGKKVPKAEWVKDGTVTVYDLWPEKPVGNMELQDNVKEDFNKRIVNASDLIEKDISVSGERGKVSEYGEGSAGDGVVQITSDYVTDKKVKAKLDAIQKSGADYNACTNNCSTFAQEGLKVLDPKTDASQTVKPTGALGLMFDKAKVVAPNNLFNKATEMKGAKVIKGPAKMEAKPYIQYFGK